MKYFFLLLLFTVNITYAQFTISGTIKSQKNIPLGSASITLFGDSLFKKTDVSGSDGNFKFTGLTERKYRVLISYTGYLTKDTVLFLHGDDYLQIILIENAVQLSDVNIDSKKDFMEKKVDRIVYNVDGISSFDNKSVVDILKGIPRLNITNNNIEIRGQGTAVVMIDDRVIYLSNKDLLDYLSIFKNDIVSVEIITNPPAKYDAQGSGLINIVTKNKKLKGVFGYVETGITKNSYLENDETLSLSYRNDNFSLTTLFESSFGAYKENVESSTAFSQGNQTDWDDIANNKNNINNNRFSLVGEWLLSKKTKLYSSYSFISSKNNDVQKHILNYISNGNLDSLGYTSGNSTNHSQTNLLNFGINSNFGEKKNTLDASVDYINKTSVQNTNTTTLNYLNNQEPTNSKYDLYSYANIPKNVLSAKIDISFPKLLAKYNVELGSKYTVFNNNSQTDYNETLNDISLFPSIATKDTFNYQEQDIAAYISLNKTYKKWVTKFGLRDEETITTSSNSSNDHYNNLFPSAFVQYKWSDQISTDLSYTRRIIRPSLFDVNPFRFYTSIFSYYVGNPTLKPSLQDNYNFNISLKSNYLFSVFYNTSYLPIVSFPLSSGNIVETEKENNGKLERYGVNFDVNYNFLKWMRNAFSASVSSYQYLTDYNYELGKVPLNITLSTFDSFELGDNFSADINFSATLPGGGYNISIQKGYSNFSCGVTKTLDKNRLILTLSAQDIFKSDIQGATTTTESFVSSISNYYDFRQLMLSVKYKFGKEVKVVRKKGNIPETYRLL